MGISKIISSTAAANAADIAAAALMGPILGPGYLATKLPLNKINAGLGIASIGVASGKALSALGKGGSTPNTPPPDATGGGTATTAVAPAAAPQLFGQANTGSQINAGGGSGQNITVTAVVSETEMTATQHFINNIQQNSVL